MKQQESSLEGAPIYVTANSLMNNDITLNAAIQIARAAGADGFELRRELLPPTMQPNETQDIRSQLQTFPFPPVYSIVPKNLAFSCARFMGLPAGFFGSKQFVR